MEFSKSQLELAGSLRRLFKSRFLVRSRNEKWFQIIVDHRSELQALLDRMGVFLEINDSLGVAHLRPLDSELEESISFQLGKKKTLTALASLLIFHLRHLRLQFYMNPTDDSVPLVGWNELREFLQNFNSSKVDSQFERHARKAIDELAEHQILIETKPESQIYEISPLCELLLPLDQIKEYQLKIKDYFSTEPLTPGEL